MHPARPRAPSRPCPACGTALDPLRAPRVVLLEDGFRYLCDDACRTRFFEGERAHDVRAALATSHSGRAGPASVLPGEEQPPQPPPRTTLGPRSEEVVAERERGGAQAAAFGLAGVALVVGLLPGPSWVGVLSATLTASAAGTTLAGSDKLRRQVGTLAWAAGPGGALLAALAGMIARLQSPDAWPVLAGAALASAAMTARWWLDGRARQPVQEVVAALAAPLPDEVRVVVPQPDNPVEMGSETIDVAAVRTGQQLLVGEGEVLGVDGVVQAGEAWVCLHPGTRATIRRSVGDPVLAGAQVVEGAVRVLATRVAGDRGLVRPARFGSGTYPGAARVARLAERLVRWGGLLVLAGVLGGLVSSGTSSVSASLSAAAAVLVAAPLLATRRSAESSLLAAAAAAGERGIIYQNAHALERAGRVTVAALCTHGTVTEGECDVVEMHPTEGEDEARLLALAAAAETAAEDHPIARAIIRHASSRDVSSESVRRASYLPGRGVTALGPDGEPIVIGNRQLLLEEGVSVAVADAEAARAEALGHIALFMSVGGRIAAVFALQDPLRAGARPAVQRIIDQGIEVVLLSGDHRGTIETLARDLDVAHVKADLLREDQGVEVRRLSETGGTVAVIGRAPRDEPALAAADVPVVLGAAGGPAGERGIALATDDVRDAAAALWIARAARGEAWRAVGVSLAAGTLLVAAAAAGLAVPPVAALFAVAIDAYALPAGARLMRRIELRVPARA